MNNHLEAFFANLDNRFNHSPVSEISEDCIRYDFFVPVSSIGTHHIILEYPHPDKSNKEIDCVIKHPNNEIEAIEFKFFRAIPSGRNNPQTQLMGQLVKDVYKLLAFKTAAIRKIVVVANDKMTCYLNNQLKLFENEKQSYRIINISKSELDRMSETFQKNIHPYNNIDICLERIFCKEIRTGRDNYMAAVFVIRAEGV
ncbi:MAG: hypothetical protein LBC60_00365 [Spirochaetaceae bacterium]|jgi:hypothetical protein|nr:hypothetical protein [Spirochaetaceae bacterium]